MTAHIRHTPQPIPRANSGILVVLRTNLIKYVKAPWTNIQNSGIGGGWYHH